MLICPLFFDDDRTKRTLPGDDNDKKAAYCENKETSKFRKFETGGTCP